MLNSERIKNGFPESLIKNGIKYNFVENNDPNAQYKSEVKCNVPIISIWVNDTSGKYSADDGIYRPYSIRMLDVDPKPKSFVRQNGFLDGLSSWWFIADLSELDDVLVAHAQNYPPAIHGERVWTEKMLSADSKLYRSLLRCVGSTLKNVETPKPEYLTPEGKRIDSVIINTEYDENDEKINPEYWSVEAMDATGKCDDHHFSKGTESYPMAIREMYGDCTGAIVIASEFTEEQIRRANEKTNVGWIVALVIAEEIDGKTIFTLVN